MKNYVLVASAFIMSGMAILVSCQTEPVFNVAGNKKPVLPSFPYSYSPFGVSSDLHTNHVATLGRVLFYDQELSANRSTACASCHDQKAAFSDPKQFSTGFTLDHTTRNSMAIINLADDKGFFWDLREVKLEEMVLKPALNHVEMGFNNLEAITERMNKIEYYKPLIQNAFGKSEITSDMIGEALATFVRSLRSNNSEFDNSSEDTIFIPPGGSIYNQSFGGFSVRQNEGKALFNKFGCTSCHGAKEDFTTHDVYANIGLDQNYTDKGVDVTEFNNRAGFINSGTPGGEGYFKVPTLRNIMLTAPYMHDGRFATIDQVIEHYNSGVKSHPNLNWQLKEGSGAPKKFNMTAAEKQALKDFLGTLTDFAFISDVRFSDPFVQIK